MSQTSPATRERPGTRPFQAAFLLVAALGIIIQLFAGVDYPPVPPGLVILVLAAALVALVGRTWAVVVAVLVAAFIVVGGFLADTGWGDLTGPDVGAATGLAVELVGLLATVVVGLVILLHKRDSGAAR